MKEELFNSFFTGGAEFWIGKVVAIDAQKQTAQGFSWGWRYKVRIFGTYSNSDNIEDKDCHTAMVMLGVTDGSGGGGRTRAVRITQHDIVFGLFMAPDQNFPVIMGVLGRNKSTKTGGGKFGILSGFTKFLQRGLTENQEFNECDSLNIPKVKENSSKVEVEVEVLIEINYHKWEKQAQNLKLIQEQNHKDQLNMILRD